MLERSHKYLIAIVHWLSQRASVAYDKPANEYSIWTVDVNGEWALDRANKSDIIEDIEHHGESKFTIRKFKGTDDAKKAKLIEAIYTREVNKLNANLKRKGTYIAHR